MGEILGWLGGMLLAFCGLPQALKCYRTGHAYGVDTLFAWMWMIGEILCLLYVIGWIAPLSWPLIANYFLNIVLVAVILKYKYLPRDMERQDDKAN